MQSIVAFSPVFDEDSRRLNSFLSKVRDTGGELANRDVDFRHFLLVDGTVENIPLSARILVPHPQREKAAEKVAVELAEVLLAGYQACLNLQPDIIIKLSVHHNPYKLLDMADIFQHTSAQMVIMPICCVQAKGNGLEQENILTQMAKFSAVKLLDFTVLKRFPIGFQAFRLQMLEKLIPLLEKGVKRYKEKRREPLCAWGLDLLSLLLTPCWAQSNLEIVFGGFTTEAEQGAKLLGGYSFDTYSAICEIVKEVTE